MFNLTNYSMKGLHCAWLGIDVIGKLKMYLQKGREQVVPQ